VSEVTLLLQRTARGEPGAGDELIRQVYDELRTMAAQKLAREPVGSTLQPTALVHEAWLRLGADHQPNWENRAHFFAAASEAMRRILIDRARHRRAARHGGGVPDLDLDDVDAPAPANDDLVLAVHEALDDFAQVDPAAAQLVKLRYFVGMSASEAAEVLGQSRRTTERQWTYARAWLRCRITDTPRSA
jgi:RNA polymerase sigma factor (TIGR02999 family)